MACIELLQRNELSTREAGFEMIEQLMGLVPN